MVETKSMKVCTADENFMIEAMADFGWTLKSSQEINTADSHLERRGDSVYSVTHKENYVKLVFDRDVDVAIKNKLSGVESQFHGEYNKNAPSFSSGLFKFLLICFVLPGVLYLILRKKQIKDWHIAHNQKMADLRKQGRDILTGTAA